MTESNSKINFGYPNKFLFSNKMCLELAFDLCFMEHSIASIWGKNMLSSYFVHGHYPFREPTVF